MTPNCIRVFSGAYVNVFDINPDLLTIEDIAHSLSHQCRFGGHTKRFYSVAEHSVFVSNYVSPEHKLSALMHDASEAFLIDVPRPIKLKLDNYKEIENKLMEALAAKFKFQHPMPQEVHAADEYALNYEWHHQVLQSTFKGLNPGMAKAEFLVCFENLSNPK